MNPILKHLRSASKLANPLASKASGKKSIRSWQILLLHLIAALVLSTSALAQSMYCPKDFVSGLESEAIKAEALIGSRTTQDPSKMRVYVSAVDWDFRGTRKPAIYLQSNYRPLAAEHAIKFVTTAREVTLPHLLLKLTRGRDFDISSVEYVVDQSFFNDPYYGQLEFDPSSRVDVAGPDNAIRRTTLIGPEGTQQERIVHWSPFISTWATEPVAITALNQVAKQPFDISRVRFLNLVIHSKTSEKIEATIPSNNRLTFNLDVLSDKASSMKQLEVQLAAAPNSILFALGHVEIETGEFVVEDAGGKEVLRLGIQELEAMAERYNTTVFSLGCKSVYHARRGTTGMIDSIEAVDRLHAAMQGSGTMGDFFTNLSSTQIRIVIDHATIEGVKIRIEASFYKRFGAIIRRRAGGGDDGGGAGGSGGTGGREGGRGRVPYPDAFLRVSFVPTNPTLNPVIVNGPASASPTPSGGEPSTSTLGSWWLIIPGILLGAVIVVVLLKKGQRTRDTDGQGKGIVGLNLNDVKRNPKPADAPLKTPSNSTPAAESKDKIIVSCSNCGVGNMVVESLMLSARCGKCKQMLAAKF